MCLAALDSRAAAQVPPPLGFGTVALDDSPCLGFLAESAGMADAPGLVAGTDFALVEDGRVKAVTGFIDKLPEGIAPA